jgi:peptidoglycan/LPS O-acetylase OafA/YrhL
VVAATLLIAVVALVVTALNHPRLGLDVYSTNGELTLCFAQFVLGLFTFRVTQMPTVKAHLRADWPAVFTACWVGASLLLRLNILAAAAFPAVVATLACNTGKVADLMSTRVPYFLGEVSFSIYLIHDPCRPLALEMLRFIHPAPLAMAPALGFAFLSSLLVIPLAWVAYITVERPGRRAVRRLAAILVQPAV